MADDQELMDMLSNLEIESLYETLVREGITKDALWELSNQDLVDMKMKKGDQLKYRRAKRKWEEEEHVKAGRILHIRIS